MPIAWHPSRYWDWCMSEDEKRETEKLWTQAGIKIFHDLNEILKKKQLMSTSLMWVNCFRKCLKD